MTQHQPTDPRIFGKLRALAYQPIALHPGHADSVGEDLLDTENVDRGDHKWGAGILTKEGRDVVEDLRASLAEGARFMETCEGQDGFVESAASDYRTLFIVSEAALDSALRGKPDAPDGEVAMAVSLLLSDALDRARDDDLGLVAGEEAGEAAVPDPAALPFPHNPATLTGFAGRPALPPPR